MSFGVGGLLSGAAKRASTITKSQTPSQPDISLASVTPQSRNHHKEEVKVVPAASIKPKSSISSSSSSSDEEDSHDGDDNSF